MPMSRLPGARRSRSAVRPRPGRVALLTAAVVLAALLGACSDEPRRTTEAMQSRPRPTEPSTPSTTELPPRDGGSEESPSTTERPGGGGSGDVDALCDSLREFAGSGATDDPQVLLDALDEWRDLAPEDLRDDLDQLIGMVEALRSVDETDPSAFAKVLETLMDPALTDAITEFGRFATEECSVELEPGLGGLPG